MRRATLLALLAAALAGGGCRRKHPSDGPLIVDCTTSVRRELAILISTGTPEAQLADTPDARRRLLLSWMGRVSPPREYITRCMKTYGPEYRACLQTAVNNGGLIKCHLKPDAPKNSALQPVPTSFPHATGSSDDTP